MMQKNETNLLEAWFKYYGYMFGYENLEVIDNGSSEEAVLETLRKYERVGCKIHRGFTTAQHFQDKGDIIHNIITGWDAEHDYDLAMPLDCDEFVTYFDGNAFSCDRGGLHRQLDQFVNVHNPIIIRNFLNNVPYQAGWFHMSLVPKAIFARGTIAYLDHGFHHPRTKSSAGPIETALTHVHLHNRKFEDIVRYSRQKLAHLVDTEDRKALRDYRGNGYHLIRYFFMDLSDYTGMYSNSPTIYFPAIVALFDALGINLQETFHKQEGPGNEDLPELGELLIRDPGGNSSTTRQFHPDYYLANAPDVALRGINPVAHYSTWGFREGRLTTRPKKPTTS